jgi:hypothetical protein
MVEAHADAMRGLGVALRSQEREEGPKEGKRPGVPPGTYDGRDFVTKGYPVNRLAMCLKGLSVKHGGFDDGNPMLQTLMRRIQNLLLGHAQECALYCLHLRHMCDDRNRAERLRQCVREAVTASNHRRQDKVLTIE